MSCKLTSNISKKNCQYAISGVKALYLFNYDSANDYEFSELADQEQVTIKTITLANNEKAYKVDFVDNTASFSDELAQNGNGGKYRTHTLNFTVDAYDYELLNQDKALSLGKFTAVVVDKAGRCIVLVVITDFQPHRSIMLQEQPMPMLRVGRLLWQGLKSKQDACLTARALSNL